ncbi:MAG: M23 family metallopeptidase [Betaproteobacteria bacterium]
MFACLAVLTAAASAAPGLAELLASRHLIVPVQGVVRSALRDTFNDVRGERLHEALDIAAARGTPVLAADDGRVAKLYTSRAGGLTLYQFDPTSKVAYYYAHLDHYAPGVREGVALRRGDVVGYVGTTGNVPPNAPHLHFAIFALADSRQWWRGTAINPFPYLGDP